MASETNRKVILIGSDLRNPQIHKLFGVKKHDLNGVSEILFPLPTPEEQEDDPRISFSFSGVQNTSRAGTAHPIVYGEVVTGSVVISAGIDTNQETA